MATRDGGEEEDEEREAEKEEEDKMTILSYRLEIHEGLSGI